MNTIPLIFNERQVNRTIFGGTEFVPDAKINAAVVLLTNQGSQFRIPVLESLTRCGFQEIISIENNSKNYNMDDIVHKYPWVKFILPLESCTDGELINIAMSELKSDYVLVLRDSILMEGDFVSPRVVEKLIEQKLFCITPRLVSGDGTSAPVVFMPSVNHSTFAIESTSVVSDGLYNLYAFDNIGLYDRKKFVQLGGFDYTIKNSHWQTVDFFFRAWLWGEQVKISTLVTLSYKNSHPVEDISADLFYGRFYLKNLLPQFDEDHGVIPKSSFFVYLLRSGCGLIESHKQFKNAREWVKKNEFRFKRDAKFLVENWGKF